MAQLTNTGKSSTPKRWIDMVMDMNLDLEDRKPGTLGSLIVPAIAATLVIGVMLLNGCAAVRMDHHTKFTATFQEVNNFQMKELAESTADAIATFEGCNFFKSEYDQNYKEFRELIHSNRLKIKIADYKVLERLSNSYGLFGLVRAYADISNDEIGVAESTIYNNKFRELERTMAHEILHLAGLNHYDARVVKAITESDLNEALKKIHLNDIEEEDVEFYNILEECGYIYSNTRIKR